MGKILLRQDSQAKRKMIKISTICISQIDYLSDPLTIPLLAAIIIEPLQRPLRQGEITVYLDSIIFPEKEYVTLQLYLC